MVVGILQLDLRVPDCHSLKQKRGALRQLISRIKNTFDVAVAEVGDQDIWQRAKLGVAAVGNDRAGINQKLDHVLNFAERQGVAEIVDHRIELINL